MIYSKTGSKVKFKFIYLVIFAFSGERWHARRAKSASYARGEERLSLGEVWDEYIHNMAGPFGGSTDAN